MAFSASHAALEGFRLVGRRPVSFVVWSLVLGVMFAALCFGAAWLFGSQFSDVFASSHLAPARALSFLGWFFAAFLVVFIVMMAYLSTIYCAIYRAILKPVRPGFAYLQFGRDEWNMVLLQLAMFVIVMVFELAGVGIGLGIYASPLLTGAKVSLIILEVLVLLVTMLITMVRWSLAGPVIVAEGRLDFGRSWSLTRHHLWPMFGMLLLAGILGLVISTAMQLVVRPISFLVFNPYQSPPPAPAQVWSRMWDLVVANPGPTAAVTALLLLATTLQTVVQLAPVAAAYRDLTAEA